MMHVRHVFNSLSDLYEKVGRRFGRRLERLLCLYRERHRREFEVNKVLRIASVAWAFMGLVDDCRTAEVLAFPEMLHRQEIELEGSPIVVVDDDPAEMLMWDVACLMLEERMAMQCAYDVAGRFASSMVYDRAVLEVDDAVVVEELPREEKKVAEEVPVVAARKETGNAVPAFPQDVVKWMMEDAKQRKDAVYAAKISEMLMRNVMQREHRELYDQLQEMMTACCPVGKSEVNFFAPVTNNGTVTGNIDNSSFASSLELNLPKRPND